jgi:hypothetical protein
MYGRTDNFKVKAIKDGCLVGWAAPQSGPLCSAVMLFAGDVLISAARADNYDADASGARVRDGWCGFELRLTPSHFVLADELTLRCANSNAELYRVSAGEVSFATAGGAPLKSVEDILRVQFESRYTDMGIFQPIILRMAATLDADKFVDFAYQFILGRKADQAGLRDYRALVKDNAMGLVSALAGSEEYKKKKKQGVLGPFSSEFPQLPIFE